MNAAHSPGTKHANTIATDVFLNSRNAQTIPQMKTQSASNLPRLRRTKRENKTLAPSSTAGNTRGRIVELGKGSNSMKTHTQNEFNTERAKAATLDGVVARRWALLLSG